MLSMPEHPPTPDAESSRDDRRLADSRRRLESIFRAAPTGIGLVANRVLLDVNDRVCEMTGYSRAELIGRSARILYPTDEDFEYVGRAKYEQIARQGTGTVETRWRRKDGQVIDVLLSSTLLDMSDLGAGVTFTALDISQRKETLAHLAALSRRNETLLAAIPDIIMEVDRHKVYTWANAAGYAFFGDDCLGREASYYFADPQKTYNNVAPLFNGDEQVVYVESRQRRRDGQVRLLAWWCRTLKDAEGNVIGALSTARDITDAKAAEDELRYRLTFENTIASISSHLIHIEPHERDAAISNALARIG
ncbi:MAG TPA: PAS domain S-box protein, partial [Phycisphaerales bacterium]|nr:PAS domain S-box protein [Phycisphaerales bacterium]